MVEELNDMIMSRYGKGLSIRRLAGVGQELTSETSLRGEDLYIPIFVKDIFLGYGLVHEARDLSFEDQSQVTRLVRMILEPHLYTQHLERTISNIEIEKSEVENGVAETKAKGLFIFGSQAKLVQKTALEIHELSENMAFLPFQDISKQINTLHDIEALDSMTLVVDLEKDLSPLHQNLLADFTKSSTNGPLVIFVASKASAHLHLENKLTETLKTLEFAVDRLPLDKHAMSEVLEMLYFKS